MNYEAEIAALKARIDADENRTMLAKIRAKKGLSMEKAALTMGITSRTLARYENAVTDIPMSIAEKMALLYEVPFEDVRQAVIKTKEETKKNPQPEYGNFFVTKPRNKNNE